MVIPDKAIINPRKEMPLWQKFAGKRLEKSVTVAASMITYSKAAQNALHQLAPAVHTVMEFIPYTVDDMFKPMEWHNKLYVKSRFADNKEYFISVLPDWDEKKFTDLLKAFSKFKKWQQSSMQLLLLPKEESFKRVIYNKLDTYKYREDIKLINDAEKRDVADLIATSYALLHMPEHDADLWPVTAALQCNTPVIAYYTDSLEEYCGEAALTVKDNSFETFGDNMNLLFRDENLRNRMIEAAEKRTAEFKRAEHIDKLWQIITGNNSTVLQTN